MSEIASAFNVSSNIKGSLRSGLAMVAKLEEQEQRKLLAWARAPRPSGLYGDSHSLISETGVEEEYADRVRMAVVMMVGSIGGSSISSEEFVNAGMESGALTEEEVPGIKRFADAIIDNRAELKRDNDRAKLQNSVLPTLLEFELSLDARVQIYDGDIDYAVPVVVAYLDTDAENQVVWFQMNEERVLEIRDKLNVALDQLEILKKWLGSSTEEKR